MNKLIYKIKDMPKETKASVAFVISNVLLKGISFITTPIFTRLLSIEEYGITATFDSWYSIIEVFAVLGLTSAGIFNSLLNDYRNNKDVFISAIIGLSNFTTIITFIFIIIINKYISNLFSLPINLLVLMFINFLFYPAQIYWITKERYEYKYVLSTIITILSTLISQIVSAFVVTNYNNDAVSKLWSAQSICILIAIPIYINLLIKGKNYFNFSVWKKVSILALPLLPHYLAQHIMSGADRVMLANIQSQTATAIYNVSSKIGNIILIVWSAINMSLTPYIYERINNGEYKRLSKTINNIFVVYGFVCIFVSLLCPEIMRILAPRAYDSGIECVPILLSSVFISSLYNIYSIVEFYYKKTKYISIATIVSTIVNILLNLILIPKYSFFGAAIATFVSYLVLDILHYMNYKKITNTSIYDDRKIFSISIITILFSLLSVNLYEIRILRYMILIVITILIILKRKDIIELFKNEKTNN